MLLLADRNFAGYELWGLVTVAGADMAWRIKKNLVLPPTPAENARLGQDRARGKPQREIAQGHLIRVIECTVTVTAADGRTRTEPFRVATTLLDSEQAPAGQLTAVYHERWESETSYGELKTRLRGAGFILRRPAATPPRPPVRAVQEAAPQRLRRQEAGRNTTRRQGPIHDHDN